MLSRFSLSDIAGHAYPLGHRYGYARPGGHGRRLLAFRKSRESNAEETVSGAKKVLNGAEKLTEAAQNQPGGAQKPPNGAQKPTETAEHTGQHAKISACRDFAAELRSWRTRLGLTQVALGEKIDYSGSFVSDIERCDRMPTLDFARSCDRKLEVPGTFARAFQRISQQSFPGWFAPVIPYESQAIKIQNWDMRCLPGLQQTPDYARAVIRAGHPDDPDDIVERDVQARMQRQEIFNRENPPSAWFIIDESALRRVYGSNAIMAAQLDKLIKNSAHPGIVIQIMPLASEDCSGVDGPMTVFDIPDSPQVAYTEGCKVGRIIEVPGEVATLVTKFDHLRAMALPRRESSRLLAQIRSDYSE
jgi:transcriptional regulator with XRE-family HTH domain